MLLRCVLHKLGHSSEQNLQALREFEFENDECADFELLKTALADDEEGLMFEIVIDEKARHGLERRQKDQLVERWRLRAGEFLGSL
jgi:hypothetical protein